MARNRRLPVTQVERAGENDSRAKAALRFTWLYWDLIERAAKLGLTNGIIGFAPLLVGQKAEAVTVEAMLYRLPLTAIFFINCWTAYRWMKLHLDWRYIIISVPKQTHNRNAEWILKIDFTAIVLESVALYLMSLSLVNAKYFYATLLFFFVIDLLWSIFNYFIPKLEEARVLATLNAVCVCMILVFGYLGVGLVGGSPSMLINFIALGIVLLKTAIESLLFPE